MNRHRDLAGSKATRTSDAMHNRALRSAPGGVQGVARYWVPHPIFFKKSDGGHVWDVDGNEYVDLWAAAGPIVLGHNDSRVIGPVVESISEHGLLFSLPHEREVALAERLKQIIPSAQMVVFGCGGSDVCHFAIRAARAFTDRPKYVKCEGAYHGWTDPLLVSVRPDLEAAGPADRPSSVLSSAGISPSVAEDCLVVPFNDADAVDTIVNEHRGEISALFVEPILHTAGCILPEPGYLEALRQICDREGILLVFDEIITGFRHDLGGYQAISGVIPDLTVVGKAMSNGFPISALVGREDVMSVLTPLGAAYYSGTFMGQPLLVEAALATIDVLETGSVHKHLFSLGDILATRVESAIEKHSINATFNHFGSIWALYFGARSVTDYRDVAKINYPIDEATQALRAALRDEGFYFHPATTRAYFMEAHSVDEVERLADALETFIESHKQQLGS